ncbi:GT1 domain-containing protein [Megalobrama amblycephala]|uniref:GT1 domain-containing protein n=1 Tax=Megalobrama amblycephala TaxID=75352 RepID=UPI00201407D0|nr:GT1 domain-containing protein [Megalobrama amblycephala]
MAKQRAAYFSPAELQLLIEGYDEVKHLIKTKGNTIAAAKVRQDAWRKISVKLNASNPLGPRRTWQQVKTKYKNIVQSANKRKAALKKMGLLPTKEEYIDEEELPPENDVEGPIIERIIGGCCSDPGDEAGCSSFVKVNDHGLNLLPPPILSDDELDSEPVEDVKTLYMKYLQVEISNRKQEMAYRALKMRKVEKEIQLLDRKLDADL